MGLSGRKIIVMISGGIAAYKAADLVSRLRKAGAEVRVAMTSSAREFVQPLTFETLSGHPVYESVFERGGSWEMEHISWARWADGVIVAPATANMIAKMAAGLADDAVTTLLLAWQGPVWIAPAMNTAMLTHPATQQNLATLRQRGTRVIAPGEGRLACGESGPGRMAEPDEIAAQLDHEIDGLAGGGASAANAPAAAEREAPRPAAALPPAAEPAGLLTAENSADGALTGQTVLVTAGPTREALDPIRFLSNRSSGRMGCELAAEARRRGARVILIHGPLQAPAPAGVQTIRIDSARELLAAVKAVWSEVTYAVFAAAVSNYELPAREPQKIKAGETLTLTLSRTPDIAAWCGAHRQPGQTLIGFCAESENLMETAAKKIQTKQLDFICANPIGRAGVGFDSAENLITLLFPDGRKRELAQADKARLAAEIWSQAIEAFPPRPRA